MGTDPDMGGTEMARIQVLPLVTQVVGSCTATEYVLVIDKLADDADEGAWVMSEAAVTDLLAWTGARAVLTVQGVLEVGNVEDELHAAATEAVQRALRSSAGS